MFDASAPVPGAATSSSEPRRFAPPQGELLTMREGTRLLVRPILPQDGQALAAMINRASDAVRQRRFPSAEGPVTVQQMERLTHVDQQRHVALVVSVQDGSERIVAEARYLVDADGEGAEFALMVDEQWQRRGIGASLMRALGHAAADADVAWLHCAVMESNTAMLGLMKRCRFYCRPDQLDARIVHVETRSRVLTARRPALRPAPRWSQWLAQWLPLPAAAGHF